MVYSNVFPPSTFLLLTQSSIEFVLLFASPSHLSRPVFRQKQSRLFSVLDALDCRSLRLTAGRRERRREVRVNGVGVGHVQNGGAGTGKAVWFVVFVTVASHLSVLCSSSGAAADAQSGIRLYKTVHVRPHAQWQKRAHWMLCCHSAFVFLLLQIGLRKSRGSPKIWTNQILNFGAVAPQTWSHLESLQELLLQPLI